MVETNVEQTREALEEIYNPDPPMKLIYRIVLFGTIGAFFAVITLRLAAPSKVPSLVFSSDKSGCKFKEH